VTEENIIQVEVNEGLRLNMWILWNTMRCKKFEVLTNIWNIYWQMHTYSIKTPLC